MYYIYDIYNIYNIYICICIYIYIIYVYIYYIYIYIIYIYIYIYKSSSLKSSSPLQQKWSRGNYDDLQMLVTCNPTRDYFRRTPFLIYFLHF